MQELSTSELIGERAEILPAREAMALVDLSNLVTIDVTNALGANIALALNAASQNTSASAYINQFMTVE